MLVCTIDVWDLLKVVLVELIPFIIWLESVPWKLTKVPKFQFRNTCSAHDKKSRTFSFFFNNNNNKKLICSGNVFTIILSFALSAPDNVKCKGQGQVYEFEGAGFVRRSSYACNNNPKNLVVGQCILSLHDGIFQCDADPECAGFGMTTNLPWHSAFDRPGLTAVQLFSKGSPVVNNTEWGNFLKTDVDSDWWVKTMPS